MYSTPVGKWVVVRSDRLVLSVDKADHLYLIGRKRQLPASQILTHKYASREQLGIVWHPPHLFVVQMGKNPSFLGATCELVPRLAKEGGEAARNEETAVAAASEQDPLTIQHNAQLRFSPSTSAKEASLCKTKSGFIEVDVPLSDPLTVTQAPDRHAVTASTLYFPDELGMPSLTVRFESADVECKDATAAVTTRTAAEMLAVPAFRTIEDEEEEARSENASASAASADAGRGGSGMPSSMAGGAEKPEWRGLLDVALQEQQRQKATRASEMQRSDTTASRLPVQPSLPPPPPPSVAPPASIPFGGSKSVRAPATGAATTTTTPTATAAAASAARHKMGFWEWKQHANGKDDDPKTWRKYNRAVAELLEEAYCDPTVVKMKIPDSAMFDKPEAKGTTYGVCFAEKALDGAMIQYSLADPGRFRLIRRTGGSPVDRRKTKKAHVIPSSSESDSEDSFTVGGSSDSDSEESASSSSSSSSESNEEPKMKKHRR
jgi:hypothetical protein